MIGESEERLAPWRDRLSAALGANGGVLAEVIPEIELIVGKQQPPPAVGPVREDYEAAYEFVLLALAVNERFNDSRRRAKIYQQFHAHANLRNDDRRVRIEFVSLPSMVTSPDPRKITITPSQA